MSLTFDEYQDGASETAIYDGAGEWVGLAYASMGAAGETGEILNKIKKVHRDHGGEIPDKWKMEIAKEIGDVLWYLSALSNELGVNLSYVAQANLDKLRSRQERGVLGGSGDNR